MYVDTRTSNVRRPREVFRMPHGMTNYHGSRMGPAHGDSGNNRVCSEWLAQRSWEDDGGRIDAHADAGRLAAPSQPSPGPALCSRFTDQ